jgi:hypothetical protein
MLCVPSVQGKTVAHAESFANGRARVAFTIPKTARHKLLKVRLTIWLGNQSRTRVATFAVA